MGKKSSKRKIRWRTLSIGSECFLSMKFIATHTNIVWLKLCMLSKPPSASRGRMFSSLVIDLLPEINLATTTQMFNVERTPLVNCYSAICVISNVCILVSPSWPWLSIWSHHFPSSPVYLSNSWNNQFWEMSLPYATCRDTPCISPGNGGKKKRVFLAINKDTGRLSHKWTRLQRTVSSGDSARYCQEILPFCPEPFPSQASIRAPSMTFFLRGNVSS